MDKPIMVYFKNKPIEFTKQIKMLITEQTTHTYTYIQGSGLVSYKL